MYFGTKGVVFKKMENLVVKFFILLVVNQMKEVIMKVKDLKNLKALSKHFQLILLKFEYLFILERII